jgi:hypothetical protein
VGFLSTIVFDRSIERLYPLGDDMTFFTDTAAFVITAPDVEPPPFTANCTPETGTPYLAIFMDSVLYEDKELTKIGCELSAGTVVPSTGLYADILVGFVDDDIDHQIRAYQYEEFVELCNGADTYYVAQKRIDFFGKMTSPAPIRTIYGPA